MKGKRTGIDFSEHEVITTITNECSIHYLKKPGTRMDSIKYINCGGVLAVTGDYGNWIFCREFHPSEKEYVSAGYWYEKLRTLSTQDGEEFDGEATKMQLQEKLNEYKGKKEERGEDVDENVIEYYEECISKCDEHELDYTYYAYREQPEGFDYEDVILVKDYKFWLKAVFDGFDELCNRLKTTQTPEIKNVPNEPSMKLYAEKGHKVKVTEKTIKNGTDYSKQKAEKFLKVGGVYTIDNMNVGDWSSDVVLQEMPDIVFNSVHFIDFKENE